MQTYILKNLLKIKNGRDHKHMSDGDIPVYGSGGLMRYVNQAIYNKESILLPRKGTLSNIQYTDKPFWSVDTLYYTQVNTDLCNPYFLYNYLINLDLSNLNSGTGVPSMTFESYYNLQIELPSLEIQNQVAGLIAALSNKIHLNDQINDNLEQMAKAIYDYWFVQFDFPNEFNKPYKSSGGEMVYNEELKREIPKGWEVKNLSSFIGVDKSGDWGKEIQEGNYIQKVECIRGADINGINGKGEIKAPVRYILEKNNHKILLENDFIVEISGGSPVQSTGRIACITNEVLKRFSNPLICSNFCKAVSLKALDEVFFFLCTWNRAYENDVLFSYEGKTSGIKNLLFEDFVTAYSIAKPSETLLNDFNKKISIFEKRRQENLKQNLELAKLRDWLLPMLMNGQVTVK
jgi:type I restriction enzyme, S subunit